MAKGRPRKQGKREPSGRPQREPAPLSPVSFVYVLKIEGHDYIKIGKAMDIQRRMSAYKTHLPFQFYLVDSVCFWSDAEAYRAEQQLLRKLKCYTLKDICPDVKHHVGEWFEADLLAVANLIEQTFPEYPWENYISAKAQQIIRQAG